jgi:hypothetical protein
MPCCLEVEAIRHGRGIVAEAQHITRPKQVQNTISCQIEQLVCNKLSSTTLDNLGIFCGRVVYSNISCCPDESETQLGAVQLALQCIVVSL